MVWVAVLILILLLLEVLVALTMQNSQNKLLLDRTLDFPALEIVYELPLLELVVLQVVNLVVEGGLIRLAAAKFE